MASGGPGDHPISDVVVYDIEVYGPETDSSLKVLSGLLSRRELYEFWEMDIGWQCEPPSASAKISAKLRWAEDRAKESGWEG